MVGLTLLWRGEFPPAQAHLDQAGACYDPEHHRDLAYHMGQDLRLAALGPAAETLWYRGYPDQALERVRHGLSVARVLSHPFCLADTLVWLAVVHLSRREGQDAHARAEELLTLAHEHGFAFWLGFGASLQGWALVERGAQSGAREQGEAGLVQLREGVAALQATGAEIFVPLFLGALAQGCGQVGQAREGLRVITEALAMVEKNEERWNEAELYRLKGKLLLQLFNVQGSTLNVDNPQSTIRLPPPSGGNPQLEAEACFLKAIAIAQKQQAKSLELRTVVSLVRLRQQQSMQHEARAKLDEAHQMLLEVYTWFTEGFDTKDLQEAKVLLNELA